MQVDGNGATAERATFSRSNAEWSAAATIWLARPEDSKNAILTSLLVDGRPIYGDPALPEAAKVFADLRHQPATMRLLLRESLARRAKRNGLKDTFARRKTTFDIKTNAILPVVNLARWAGLSAGSAELPTVERLRAAAGSEILPYELADTLIDAFENLQRLRLRYQLAQHRRGERPSDILHRDHVSSIDQSTITEAVREIAAAQKRLAKFSAFVPADEWLQPDDSNPKGRS
ncbi:Putative signal transduction protein with CBS domains (fragment) [Nostocoides japonicum T1-X7]|uniref:Putative signal transduction protein with CBS domains n=1 Tax=Nostocoides japonicum T1-X7 TaxID=1194083 RepID=A0A077M4F9_9MICO